MFLLFNVRHQLHKTRSVLTSVIVSSERVLTCSQESLSYRWTRVSTGTAKTYMQQTAFKNTHAHTMRIYPFNTAWIIHELNTGRLGSRPQDTDLAGLGLPGQSTQGLGVANVVRLLQHGPTCHPSLNGNKDNELKEQTAAFRMKNLGKMIIMHHVSRRRTKTYLFLNVPHDNRAVAAGRRLATETWY